jgi:hypothetical protein
MVWQVPCFPRGVCTINSRSLPRTSFALATVRNLRRMLLPLPLWVALSIGLCQQSLAQHGALELGPEEAAPTLPAGGVTALEMFAGTETKEVQGQDGLGR